MPWASRMLTSTQPDGGFELPTIRIPGTGTDHYTTAVTHNGPVIFLKKEKKKEKVSCKSTVVVGLILNMNVIWS